MSTDQDRTAVVTGAGKGIGKAIAHRLSRAGYRLGVLDVDLDAAHETVDELQAAGAEGMAAYCDVSSAASVDDAFGSVLTAFGRLDAAVNNAGIGTAAVDIADLAESDWDRVIGIDLKGVWLSMRAEIPVMLAGGRGSIVNVASVLGLKTMPAISPAYVAAKHGVVGLTKLAALQYATRGLRVNAVCPGTINTPGVAERLARTPNDTARRNLELVQPMERMGTPDEIAEAVAWLCEDAASFVTGIAMPVDGGWMTR